MVNACSNKRKTSGCGRTSRRQSFKQSSRACGKELRSSGQKLTAFMRRGCGSAAKVATVVVVHTRYSAISAEKIETDTKQMRPKLKFHEIIILGPVVLQWSICAGDGGGHRHANGADRPMHSGDLPRRQAGGPIELTTAQLAMLEREKGKGCSRNGGDGDADAPAEPQLSTAQLALLRRERKRKEASEGGEAQGNTKGSAEGQAPHTDTPDNVGMHLSSSKWLFSLACSCCETVSYIDSSLCSLPPLQVVSMIRKRWVQASLLLVHTRVDRTVISTCFNTRWLQQGFDRVIQIS